MKGRKLIALDFDGVLHSYAAAWRGPGIIPDPPVPGAMEFLCRLALSQEFDPAIYSSRSKSLAGRRAMKAWIRQWICALEIGSWGTLVHRSPTLWQASENTDLIMSYISWPWFKPPAWLTIDDRAVQFTGTFPSFPEMLAFQPWNKRSPNAIRQSATQSQGRPGAFAIPESPRKLGDTSSG